MGRQDWDGCADWKFAIRQVGEPALRTAAWVGSEGVALGSGLVAALQAESALWVKLLVSTSLRRLHRGFRDAHRMAWPEKVNKIIAHSPLVWLHQGRSSATISGGSGQQ